jgi:Fuc2NAc and GlcNAc transferase
MPERTTVLALAALLLSAVGTGAVRRFALSRGVIDVPNRRSSHARPTPRGGGAVIAIVTTLALLVLAGRGSVPWTLFAALGGGGLAVAVVGFLDDRSALSAGRRLLAHFAAAIWAVFWLGAPSAVQAGHAILGVGPFGYVLAVLAITWSLNLFNFMDGIDGIAGSQAVFVACGAAWLASASPASSALAASEWVVAAASGGFLLWNWPPAKIFMGDVGSGYLGYTIGVLAVASATTAPSALWPWLILNGAFVVDSTVTPLRRLLQGDRIHEAHRTHAYQWQARRTGSHLAVTLSVVAINIIWLLPWARAATASPAAAAWITLAALTPLGLLALWLGAGRRELPAGTPTAQPPSD